MLGSSWHPFLLLFFFFSSVNAQPQFGFNLPQPQAVQVLPQQAQPSFPTFPVLQGVPQMPLAVQPLQPFGLQSFQPQSTAQVQPFPGLQGVQTFSSGGLPGFPVVQQQLNPFNPFALPGFQLPSQNFAPFPGIMNVSPLYSTNQGGQPPIEQPIQQPAPASQQVQPQVQPAARPQFEVPQGVQLQQETDSVRVAPVLRARATPAPAPATTTATPPPTTPAPITTEAPESSTLKIVDARSDRKPAKKSTTALPFEISSEEEDIDDNIPPEVPKELTEMRRRLDEEEDRIEATTRELTKMKRRLEEEEKLIQETATLIPTRKRDHWASIQTGSATPKVIDFRSISQPKITTPGPRGGEDEEAEAAKNDKEIEEILGRVLDAVAPMHNVAASSSEIEFRHRKA